MSARAPHGLGVVLISHLLGACAGTVAEDLPPGWADAQPLEVEQSSCHGGDVGGHPRLQLSRTVDALAGTYQDAAFRCSQHLCGFVMDAREVTRVLIQPCEMHPSTVTSCACLYDVSFHLRARAGRALVELYRRRDLYGADAPVDATLVAREAPPW